MIYLFTGSDVHKVRAKAFQWIAAARAKAPEAPYIRLGAEQLSEESLRHAILVQGLFFTKSLILLDDPFAKAESANELLELLAELGTSPNIFVILAPKLLPARLKKVEAIAEKVFTNDAVKKGERGFNSSLVNALGAKDGKGLWKEIVKAYRLGDAPEMVHGLLHWKARDMMKKGNREWSDLEARTLSRDLILLLSDARGKDLPLDLALERFALSLT